MAQRTLFRPAQPPQIQLRRPPIAVLVGPNTPPTVVLNTPADASSTSDKTPTFAFIGTDAENDDVRYQIEIGQDTTAVFDSYSVATQSTVGLSEVAWHGQSFHGQDVTLTSATFYIHKEGTPGGNVAAILYAHSGVFGTSSVPTGAALATSDAVVCTALSTTPNTAQAFTFSTPYVLSSGTDYFISLENDTPTHDASNHFLLALDNTTPTHAGNFAFDTGGGWAAEAATDTCFSLTGGSLDVVLTATSGTDAGFEADIPEDTDPFDSSTDVEFTVADLVLDSYSESNAEATPLDINPSVATGIGQSFTGIETVVSGAKFYLKKFGSPTGNAVAKLYAHSGTFGTSSVPTGTALATSNNFDVSTLTGTAALYTFTFPTPYMMTAGTKYVLTFEYGGGDISNTPSVYIDESSPAHGGNLVLNVGAWGAEPSADLCFYVLGGLPVGDYQWRVRAIDPSGSNTYGAWTSYRTFSISAGGAVVPTMMHNYTLRRV